MEEKCIECNGKGYLINVHQYNADGILECDDGIERCDACMVFESDKEAKEYLKGREKMGSLKNILQHCKENEKEFALHEIVSRDRDRNKGWIECCEFFLRNFHITEKEIREDA